MTHSRCAWKRLCFPCVMTPENSTRPCAEPLRTSSQLPASMPTTESRPGGATGVAGPAGGSAGVATRGATVAGAGMDRAVAASREALATRPVSKAAPAPATASTRAMSATMRIVRARERERSDRGASDDGMVVSNGAAASVRSARISSRAGRAGAHSGAATEKEAVGVTCDATLGTGGGGATGATEYSTRRSNRCSNHAPAQPASCQPNVRSWALSASYAARGAPASGGAAGPRQRKVSEAAIVALSAERTA